MTRARENADIHDGSTAIVSLGTVTAGTLGDNVTGGAGLTGRYFFLYKSGNTNQAVSANTITQVTFGGIIQSHSAVSGNDFTATADDVGNWFFKGRIGFYSGSNNLNSSNTKIYKNSTVIASGYWHSHHNSDPVDSLPRHLQVETNAIITIAEGDVITMKGSTGYSGNTLFMFAGSGDSMAHLSTSLTGIKL